MKKMTLNRPGRVKRRVENIADIQNAGSVLDTPEPRLPLTGKGLGDPTIAERVDDLLERSLRLFPADLEEARTT
jgi:hypothetical protein